MTTALIFAGGVGERMNTRTRPKQFLEIHGKPIIIYTIEWFEDHPEVDAICVVCLEEWIEELKREFAKNFIEKVKWIVPGGETGHDSIYNGLQAICSEMAEDDIVLIHDGVRPLISSDLITDNIKCTKEKGNAVTVSKETESLAKVNSDGIFTEEIAKFNMRIIQAPQTFYFKDIWEVHQRALQDQVKAIDSADLISHYGGKLHTVEGFPYNLKITSPSDYYIFRAIYEARENLQVFGV